MNRKMFSVTRDCPDDRQMFGVTKGGIKMVSIIPDHGEEGTTVIEGFISFGEIRLAVDSSRGDEPTFFSLLYSMMCKSVYDGRTHEVDESEYPFDNLTMGQLINMARAA